MGFLRPQHTLIAEILKGLDGERLLDLRCWFGGGTCIVLQNGEYRLSLDLDFLCADRDGYRDLRSLAMRQGGRGLVGTHVGIAREFLADQYGIRGVVTLQGQPIRLEIVREARIELEGQMDPDLGVPTLTFTDQVAEKLLANADQGLDRAVAFRDAIDLGMLMRRTGTLPAAAVAKADAAYGNDVRRKLLSVLHQLKVPDMVAHAATTLQMQKADVIAARDRLVIAAAAAWPDTSHG
ncbi:MAG: hypothetical protein RLY86_2812 [Pseudomonadota bacterium]|jgi:hypothetical protein